MFHQKHIIFLLSLFYKGKICLVDNQSMDETEVAEYFGNVLVSETLQVKFDQVTVGFRKRVSFELPRGLYRNGSKDRTISGLITVFPRKLSSFVCF